MTFFRISLTTLLLSVFSLHLVAARPMERNLLPSINNQPTDSAPNDPTDISSSPKSNRSPTPRPPENSDVQSLFLTYFLVLSIARMTPCCGFREIIDVVSVRVDPRHLLHTTIKIIGNIHCVPPL